MKHVVISLLLSSVFITGYAFAQTQKQYDKVRDRIQKELNIDEVKADSTATILRHYFTVVKSVRENEGMTDENKQLAIKKERRQDVAKLKTFLTQEQIKRLHQMVQQYRDMRQNNGKNNPADTSLKKYYF